MAAGKGCCWGTVTMAVLEHQPTSDPSQAMPAYGYENFLTADLSNYHSIQASHNSTVIPTTPLLYRKLHISTQSTAKLSCLHLSLHTHHPLDHLFQATALITQNTLPPTSMKPSGEGSCSNTICFPAGVMLLSNIIVPINIIENKLLHLEGRTGSSS